MTTTCLAHPDRTAQAACSACGADLCDSCVVTARGASWCDACFAGCVASAAASSPPPPPGPAVVPGSQVKSPFLAAFLSLVPGFGTIYCFGGPARRGLVQFAAWALGLWVFSHASGLLAFLAFLATTGFYFWQMADAYGTARLFNSLGRVPSEDEAARLGRGPYLVDSTQTHALGMALLVLGCVLLAAEVIGALFSAVEWIWPFALIGVGAWITWRARRRRASGGAADVAPDGSVA